MPRWFKKLFVKLSGLRQCPAAVHTLENPPADPDLPPAGTSERHASAPPAVGIIPGGGDVSDGWKKQAALFLISQNLSLFGSSVVGFALVWHITLDTTSGLWMTIATIAMSVPQVLLLPWGGVWADRHDKRLMIIVSDGFVALVTLGLAIAFLSGTQSLWLLMGALALRALGSGVQSPASAALYPSIVPPEHLNRVQGINQTINAVLMLLSPAAGGLLLGSMSLAWAMMVDVITATIAIIVMCFLSIRHIPKNTAHQPVLLEMREGLLYTFRHPRLRLLLLSYAAFFFLVTPAAVLSPLMVARTFGEDVWRLTANELVWSGMAIVGGLFVSWRGEYRNKPAALAVCMGAFGFFFTAIGFAPTFTLFLVLMGAAGFFMPVFMTTSTVFIQQTAEPGVLGRVFSITQITASGSFPVAIVLFGPLADVISVELIIIATGLLMMGTGFWYYRVNRRADQFDHA